MSIQMFPKKLKTLRTRRGLSQRALAEVLGLTHTHIQNLENGKSSPGAEVVVKLARLFGVTTDQLLLDELDLPPEGL